MAKCQQLGPVLLREFKKAIIQNRENTVFRVLRDTKWLLAVSIFISGVLFLPSQIQEVYRAILADPDPIDISRLYTPLFLIGLIIWLGANQVTIASEGSAKLQQSHWFCYVWPAFLGTLPLLCSAIAQFSSVPSRFAQAGEKLKVPGSVWDKLDVELAQSAGNGLFWGGLATLFAALLFFVGTSTASFFMRQFSDQVNQRYFYSWRFFAVTMIAIFLLTVSFILLPVSLPQLLGVLGLIALFTLCVVAFCVHLSLMTIDVPFPFLPVLFVCAAFFSIADLNDNHDIRLLATGAVGPSPTPADRAFEDWFQHRPDIQSFTDEYPIYIVAAQGGGIYAAYEAGIFLSRMQDICPAFRDHLFAISAVSGGSVGAAVFASSLQLSDEVGAANLPSGPCPVVTQFLNEPQSLNASRPKPFEQYVNSVLSHDLLSPLVAAALFPDFLQRFLPFRVLPDRARALEFALEEAADSHSSKNRLKESYFSSWRADGSSPALLLNATDVGSGRRIIFSPFVFKTGNSRAGSDSLLHFATLNNPQGHPFSGNLQQDLRLSTAAIVTARFPWITPAATIRKVMPAQRSTG